MAVVMQELGACLADRSLNWNDKYWRSSEQFQATRVSLPSPLE